MLLNDRLQTVIFWGAISLSLHALFIAFSPKQPVLSDSGSLEVQIVRPKLSDAAQDTAPQVSSPAAVPRLPDATKPSPAQPPTAPAAADQSRTEPGSPTRLQTDQPATPVTAAPLRDIVSSENGQTLAPGKPKRTPAPPTPTPAQTTVKTAAAATDSDAVDADKAAMETAAIIERLVGEDEREVAERLAEIPTTDSEYWNYLMNRLAQPKWHHNQFNFRTLKRKRTLAVDLEFYPTGIVRAARIARSSGLEALDAAAIRASYAAAPYTPPPAEDRKHGYTYRIKLQYLPATP